MLASWAFMPRSRGLQGAHVQSTQLFRQRVFGRRRRLLTSFKKGGEKTRQSSFLARFTWILGGKRNFFLVQRSECGSVVNCAGVDQGMTFATELRVFPSSCRTFSRVSLCKGWAFGDLEDLARQGLVAKAFHPINLKADNTQE